MKIKRRKNNKERGFIEFFVYREKKNFVGVCLSFDIVLEGNDPNKVMKNLQDAALLHLKVVRKNNFSDDLLNRYAPEKYWTKYFKALTTLKQSRLKQKQLPETRQIPYAPNFSLGPIAV